MTIPTYPSVLPPPLRADYAQTAGEGRLMFRPDAGPPMPRLRFASAPDIIPFSTLLERWQLGVFENFYIEQTRRGSLPFYIPAPMNDGVVVLDENLEVVLDENDEPMLYPQTMLVLFADQGLPTSSQIDVEAYRVSFRLMRLSLT